MSDVLNGAAIAAPAVREALRRAASPLSDCQRRVWRLATMDPKTMWAERIALTFSGPLRIGALDAALRELVRRHAILRSVFVVLDGEAMQCVRTAARAGLLVVDLEALAPACRHRAAADLVRCDRQTPLDVRRGPLIRTVLLRRSPADHVLLLMAHHLVFDGWSQSVMFRELAMSFMAFAMNVTPPLPELRSQYGDLARREQDAAHAAARTARLNECAARLRGLRPPATLPLDRPRPAHGSHRADAVPFVVPDDAHRMLRSIAECEGATSFMLGVAVLALALRVASPTVHEITFGVAAANRPSLDAQALIGPFVNIVVVRLSIDAEMTVGALIRHAKVAVLDAFAYQDVPFDRVMDALHPGVSKGSYGPTDGDPLFRVCVDFTESADAVVSASAPSDLIVTPLDTDGARSGCDLYLNLSATRDALRGRLMYSAELFDRRTIVAFVNRFLNILGSLDRRLDCRLAEVQT
jgi:hypothetical protein